MLRKVYLFEVFPCSITYEALSKYIIEKRLKTRWKASRPSAALFVQTSPTCHIWEALEMMGWQAIGGHQSTTAVFSPCSKLDGTQKRPTLWATHKMSCGFYSVHFTFWILPQITRPSAGVGRTQTKLKDDRSFLALYMINLHFFSQKRANK